MSMSNVVIQLTTVFMLTANLLVPQQIVSYRPCCYDENGKLSLHLQCGCQTTTTPSLSERRECCDPIISKLRHENSSLVAPSTFSKADIEAPVPESVSVTSFIAADAHAVSMLFDTGPPHVPDFLTLHSRLNL